MTSSEIQGVFLSPLRVIGDHRGAVLHLMRADSPNFAGFGEVYISSVLSGVVKAWKRHRLMTQSMSVPQGSVEFVFYDDRPDSPTRGNVHRLILSRESYALLRIPPMVWYGFRGLAPLESFIVNCASLPHSPDEVDRLPEDSPMIPFAW